VVLTAQRLRAGENADAWYIEQSLHDPSSFAVLYDRHAAALYRYACRRVGQDAAEDVVSETFLTAFRRRQRYDLDRPDALAWLFGILTKEISRLHRQEMTRLRSLQHAERPREMSDLAEDVVAVTAAHAVRGPLAAAVAELSAGDRHVLLLVAWSGLTYEETALALGIPVGTVRSRLNRARRKVCAALGGDNPTRVMEEWV
jgi:RNA polymerase sigma-70 factor (ECF subfamily)